jgi:hypothetical protein
LLSTVLVGCTFSGVKPELAGTPPPQPPKALVVGDVTVTDKLWDTYRLHFARGVSDWLKRNGGFETVYEERPAVVPEGSIVLMGRITEIDKGSAVARALVGMGAGQAQVKGSFEIQDPAGTVLATFSARESYLGGAGMGGFGMLDMEDLVKRFAETVAETTRNWARGEKITER